MDAIELRSPHLALRFDRDTGALTRVEVPDTGWAPLDREELGLSYQLVLPTEGRRGDRVEGVQQRLASADLDGQQLRLAWEGVRTERGENLDLSLHATIRLDGARARFDLEVENRSRRVLESVAYPVLGDVQPPDASRSLKTFANFYGSAQQWEILPRYQNTCGYWGVDYPTQIGVEAWAGAPMLPFILLRGPEQGLYWGVDNTSTEVVAWSTELHPGYRDGMDEVAPAAREIGDLPVFVRFSALHLPYLQPGERRRLTPVVLQPYQGGWQQGVELYRSWRVAHLALPERPRWVDEPHSWLQIQMNSPADELRFRFSELPEVARECARHGIGAIQLVGWNDGGQDQHNPTHQPDPRLGTPEELRDAIAEVRAMGVRTILFSKFTWADRATGRFRTDLRRLAIEDPYGDYYVHRGYRYQTPAQLLDVDTKRLVPMCFLAEEYLQVCEEEFRRVLALRPDGILFDECLHHGPAQFCFAAGHGHRPGAPVYANDRELIRRLRALAEKVGIEFVFAGEGVYDWEFDAYQVSYHRSASSRHVPVSRFIHPHVPLVTALTGADDRNVVNQSLLYRYALSYEPYNFKGRPEDFPLTLAYGKRMDALRRELRAHLWDGVFRDELGASVVGPAGPHHPYAVFIAADGSRCVAVANYDDQEEARLTVRFDGGEMPPRRWRLVEDTDWRSGGDRITVPPRSAAVVLE